MLWVLKLKCPYCLSSSNRVIDKRETSDGDVNRRRRECLDCSKRFTTYEHVQNFNITVLKSSGHRESFSREKLKKGILKACEKRPVAPEKVESVVNEIESELKKKYRDEVKSSIIGAIVLRKLKKVDKVAYIRFASVFRSFDDLESFEQEVLKLLNKGSEVDG